MKHAILGTGLLIAALFSCNNSTEINKTKSDSVVTEPIVISDTTVTTGDNSSNALDWQGAYTGIVPCADCEGIETTILLNKNMTYNFTTKYLGKKDASATELKGTFGWNKEGNTITLSGIKNTPSQYLVGENKLFQLDMNGKRITGNLAAKYILIKK